MATENTGLINHGAVATADLSSYQYYMVKLSSSGWSLCTTQGESGIIGVLLNDPVSGQVCDVMLLGKGKAKLGGTVALGDPLCVNSSGKLVKANDNDEFVVGRSMAAGSANDIGEITVGLGGPAAAGTVMSQETYTAHANYSSTGQYLAVKAHTDAGEVILCAAAGERILGILQNAPAASAEAEVCTYGECTAKAGSGGVAAGANLAIDASGQVVTASGTAQVIGWAVAAIAEGATGTIFVAPIGMYSVDGATLASGKIWLGNGSNVAVAVTPSGDATIDNAGAITIGNDKVTAAKMSTAAAGVIFKGAAANAVTELQLTAGLIPIGTTNDVTTLDLSGSAGDMIVSNGTTGTVVAMSGDATISGTGALTIANDVVSAAKMASTAGAGSGIIFKGTNTANAVTELNVPVGHVIVGTTNDVTTLDMGATAGNIMVDSGTAPASVAVSGDATLAANGALTIANDAVTAAKMGSTAGAGAGIIFKGTNTANAVTELNVAAGSLIVGTTNDVTTLAVGTKGRALRVNGPGTTPTYGPDKIVYEDFSAYAATDQVANMLQAGGVAFSGATDALHHCYTPAGNVFCFEALGAGQTLEPVITADGLNVAGDQTNDEGYEIYSHFLGASGHPFRVGEAAFYFLCKFLVTGCDGTDDLQVGFRRAEICRPNFDDYLDAATLGCNTAASPMAIKIATINDGAATVETDTTQTLANATAVQFKIMVDAAGAVTYQHDIATPGTLAAPAATAAFSFDAGDPVIPFFRVLQVVAPGTGAVPILLWDAGYQA